MNEGNRPEVQGKEHIYHADSSWYSVPAFAALILLLLFVAFTWNAITRHQMAFGNNWFLGIFSLCIFVILFIYLLILFFRIRQSKLIFGPEGVTCYAPTCTIYSPWEHVARPIALNWGRSTMISLGLDQAAQNLNIEQALQQHRLGFEARNGLVSYKRRRDTIPVGYFIPAGIPVARWPETLLAQDIVSYKPDFFQIQQ